MITIGIDPSASKSTVKFAWVQINWETKVVTGGLFRRWRDFIAKSHEWAGMDSAFVALDNSGLINKTFDMRGSKAVVARKSRDVGKNMQHCEHIIEQMEYLGIGYTGVSPKASGKKKSQGYLLCRLRAEGLTLHLHKFAIISRGPNKGMIKQDVLDALDLALDWALPMRSKRQRR